MTDGVGVEVEVEVKVVVGRGIIDGIEVEVVID